MPASRFWQGRCIGTSIGEQVHGDDAFALGSSGAAMGHRPILGVFRLTRWDAPGASVHRSP